jgi:RHS repeat-associated protein
MKRGFTGHEMDSELSLINMNARLYSPVLGRFISADTIVPNPGNMQDFNRYAYVNNNPLLYIDPTGHWKLKNFWKAVKPFVAIAAAFAFQQYELLPGIWGSIGAGAVGGAINGGARGALIGAFAGGMFSGIHGIEFSENIISDTFQRSMAHGFVGSGMSALSGGDIGTGFLSAFVPGAFGTRIGVIGGDDFACVFSRTVMAGAIGGVSAKVAGGDFWDGFQTGAFARLFNHEYKSAAEAEAGAVREAMGYDVPGATARHYLAAAEFWGNAVSFVFAPIRGVRIVFDYIIDPGITAAKIYQDGNFAHAFPVGLGRAMTSGIGNIASGATAARAGIATSVTVDKAIEFSPGYGERE